MELDDRIRSLNAKQRQLLTHWLHSAASSEDDSTADGLGSRQQLHAYVTSAGESDASEQELLEHLRRQLPEFMVPESVTILDALPRLPNGKIDYRTLPFPTKQSAQHQTDAVVGPRSDAENTLHSICCKLLQTNVLSIHDNFFEVGGDSIMSIQLVSLAREAGLDINPGQLAQYPTIAQLASVAESAGKEPDDPVRDRTGEGEPTPIQCWFLSRKLDAPNHWNQTRQLQCDDRLSTEQIEFAVNACWDRHDGLRATFHRDNGHWKQEITDASDRPIPLIRLPMELSQQQLNAELTKYQASFQIDTGPLIKFILHADSRKQTRLTIIAHHLVIDQVSWSILLRDLDHELERLLVGKSTSSSAKTTPVLDWTTRLKDRANSDPTGLTSFWSHSSGDFVGRAPTDLDQFDWPTEENCRTCTSSLDHALTGVLTSLVNEAYQTRTEEIVLTGLLRTLSNWFKQSTIRIDVERHGRENIFETVDLSQTVGWFTAFFPIEFSLSGDDDLAKDIKAIKERLRSVPHGGLDYGIVKYLSDATETRAQLQPYSDVLFNFLGSSNSTVEYRCFGVVNESQFGSRAPSNERSHLIEINAGIVDGQLSATWTFSEKVHHAATIEQLADGVMKHIAELIEHCLHSDSLGYTPSDFPESGLNQEELDELFDELE